MLDGRTYTERKKYLVLLDKCFWVVKSAAGYRLGLAPLIQLMEHRFWFLSTEIRSARFVVVYFLLHP